MNLERRDALWQEMMAMTAPVFEISPFRTRPLATPSSTMSAKRTATGTPTSSPSALHGTSTSKSQPPATPTCSPNWKPLVRFHRAACSRMPPIIASLSLMSTLPILTTTAAMSSPSSSMRMPTKQPFKSWAVSSIFSRLSCTPMRSTAP